jgi:hypothetical protein
MIKTHALWLGFLLVAGSACSGSTAAPVHDADAGDDGVVDSAEADWSEIGDEVAIDLPQEDQWEAENPPPDVVPSDGEDEAQEPDVAPDTPPVCAALSENCGGPGQPCAPGDRCGSLYTDTGVRNWPVSADATGSPMPDGRPSCYCASPEGEWPAIGVGSATWFDFVDCGTYKDYDVSANCRFAILSYTDCCSGCMLQHIAYDIQEDAGGGTWVTAAHIDYPETHGTCQVHTDYYDPETGRVRILNTGAFYVCVFQE